MVKGSEMEQTTKNASQVADAPKAGGVASGHLGSIRRFRDVEQDYARAREQAWVAAQRRCEAAQRRHAEALASLQKDIQSKLEQAFKAGADAWDATRSDDASGQYQELNRQYLAATNSIVEEARERFAESVRVLNKECEDAGNELNDAARAAYRNYLRSLQETWRALDIDAIVDAYALAQAISPRI